MGETGGGMVSGYGLFQSHGDGNGSTVGEEAPEQAQDSAGTPQTEVATLEPAGGGKPKQAPRRRQAVRADITRIQRGLSLLMLPLKGYVYELRVPKYKPHPNAKPQNKSWHYGAGQTHEMASQAEKLSRKGVKAVYVTLNPLPALPEGSHYTGSAADGDILKRALLLVDCDPTKPANTNATAGEKEKARVKALEVRDYLRGLGWPEPVLADSGNGYHLLYRIDLPNDDDATALVRNALRALAHQFNTDAVKIDTTVFNASRITKVYGTVARKGEHTKERPHRKSAVLEKPNDFTAVPHELLEALAAEAPVAQEKKRSLTSPKKSTKEAEDRPRVLKGLHLDDALNRARPYIMAMPDSIDGQNGHTALFDVAQALVRGYLLTPDQASPLLEDYNNHKAHPPWDADDLWRKLDEAEHKSKLPWGYVIDRKDEDTDPVVSAMRSTRKATNPTTKEYPPLVNLQHYTAAPDTKLEWLWKGYLARGEMTLFSAPPKTGKSTLLSHLLGAVSRGEKDFCGLKLSKKFKAAIITQEHRSHWARRADQLGLDPNFVLFQEGPDRRSHPGKRLRPDEWGVLAEHLAREVTREGVDLVIVDTLADFWPVQEENAAGQITDAVAPLDLITEAGAALLAVHHVRKSGGDNGVGIRGSGQLAGYFAILLELKRDKDQYRTLACDSRHPDTPERLKVYLHEGRMYATEEGEGPESDADHEKERNALVAALRAHPDKATFDELKDSLGWGKDKLKTRLDEGVDGQWIGFQPHNGPHPALFWLTDPSVA